MQFRINYPLLYSDLTNGSTWYQHGELNRQYLGPMPYALFRLGYTGMATVSPVCHAGAQIGRICHIC